QGQRRHKGADGEGQRQQDRQQQPGADFQGVTTQAGEGQGEQRLSHHSTAAAPAAARGGDEAAALPPAAAPDAAAPDEEEPPRDSRKWAPWRNATYRPKPKPPPLCSCMMPGIRSV